MAFRPPPPRHRRLHRLHHLHRRCPTPPDRFHSGHLRPHRPRHHHPQSRPHRHQTLHSGRPDPQCHPHRHSGPQRISIHTKNIFSETAERRKNEKGNNK